MRPMALPPMSASILARVSASATLATNRPYMLLIDIGKSPYKFRLSLTMRVRPRRCRAAMRTQRPWDTRAPMTRRNRPEGDLKSQDPRRNLVLGDLVNDGGTIDDDEHGRGGLGFWRGADERQIVVPCQFGSEDLGAMGESVVVVIAQVV